MPDQHPVRVQRALRRPDGAGGVGDEGRVVGAGRRRGAGVGRLAELLPEAVGAALAQVDREHRAEVGQFVADRDHLGQVRPVRDQRLRARVREPEKRRPSSPNSAEQRHDHRAEPVGGEMREQRLRGLRQQHRDPVAPRHAMRRQRVRQPPRGAGQLRVGPVADLAVGAHVAQRDPVRRAARPVVADRGRDVVAPRPRPAERRAQRVPVEAGRDQRSAGRGHRFSPSPSSLSARRARQKPLVGPGQRCFGPINAAARYRLISDTCPRVTGRYAT